MGRGVESHMRAKVSTGRGDRVQSVDLASATEVQIRDG